MCSMASAHKHKAAPQQKTRQVKTVELVDQAVSRRSQIATKRWKCVIPVVCAKTGEGM